MRTETFEFNLDDTASMVRMLIKQLESYRTITQHPEELEWEIRVYQYILKDPEKRLMEYGQARRSQKVSKRMAIAKLGWDIP